MPTFSMKADRITHTSAKGASAIKSNDNNRRPWDSDLSRDADGGGRERSPSSGGPKNSKG